MKSRGLQALVALSACLGALGPARARAEPPGADGRALRAAADATTELRLEDATRLLAPLEARYPDDADVLFESALLRFHRGEYATALAAMERSVSREPTDPDIEERRALTALVRSTRDATATLVTARSADGRYVVMHEPGPDAVLVPYALEVLAAADRALEAELGSRLPGPIRLEILSSPQALSRVSTLTVEEIERTGTIALCKWNRLMITSPRALVRGYPWMDTIAHELGHLALSHASRDRAPVWLQEGTAKLFERRWRGETGGAPLEPASRALLEGAVRDERLIPFDQLHPSIARLPSQDDAALAFAQVATFMEMFVGRVGRGGMRDAIARIAAGTDAREAVAATAGGPWARLEADWKRGLRERPALAGVVPRVLALRFRHGEGSPDESLDVPEERARRFLRLGDLLWTRGHERGAALEYERAQAAAPGDPVVTSRFARASLAAGTPERAVSALRTVLASYPDYAPAHAVLGAALVALGRPEEARPALRDAIRINPFDPAPHCDLFTAASDEAERRRESDACRALGGASAAR